MAISYSKVNWDTSKYVNPTNMNQMDNGIKAACDGVDALDTELDSKTSTITLPIEANYGVLKVVKYGKIVSLSWSTGETAQHIPTGVSTIATGLPIPDAYVYPSMQGGVPCQSTLWAGFDGLVHSSVYLVINHLGELLIGNGTNAEFDLTYSGAYITYICE